MGSPTDSRTGLSATESPGSTGNPGALASGDSSGVGTRVQLGLIGLDRAGQFHAERLSLRPEFEVVAGCEPLGEAPRRLPGPRAADRPVYSRVDELLERADIDTIVIAGPSEQRVVWGLQSLEAKKHVALDVPPCANAGQLRDLLAVARRTGRRLLILPTRRLGTEFRTALRIARGDQLGPLDSARLISWGMAVPQATSGSVSGSRTADSEVDPFTFFAYQYVDQLLQLLRGRPRSVFGRILPPSTSDPAVTAFVLSIGFEPGSDALIDVNLKSGAVLQTGWMLAGARGGYSGGRIYLHDASGEICDAPVPPTDLPEIDVYGELVALARGKSDGTDSAKDAEIVMRVIDAARESSRTGQTISLDR
jgi:predicted dehydrogenase